MTEDIPCLNCQKLQVQFNDSEKIKTLDPWTSIDLREGDIYTIAGIYNKVTGELQQFTFKNYYNEES